MPSEMRGLVNKRNQVSGNTTSIADEAEAWLATQSDLVLA